jgi:hypothetical protein
VVLGALLPAAAWAEETVPAAVAPVFRKWSQSAFYRPAERCCGAFEYKTGRAVRAVLVSGRGYVGICSADMGAWELFSTARPPIESVRSGEFHGDAETCRGLAAPIAPGLEFAESSLTLPDLRKYFRALPLPSAAVVGRVRAGLVRDLRMQLPKPCTTSAVLIGKWTAEAGEGYGTWNVAGRACRGGVLAFTPGREPLGVQVKNGPQWRATARAVAAQAVGRYTPYTAARPQARSHSRRIFDKVTLGIVTAAIPAGGIYLVATSPQQDGIHKGRLAGGSVLTVFGAFFACVVLGPCAV